MSMVFDFGLALAAGVGALSFFSGRKDAKRQRERDDMILAEQSKETKRKKKQLQAEDNLSSIVGVQRRRNTTNYGL